MFELRPNTPVFSSLVPADTHITKLTITGLFGHSRALITSCDHNFDISSFGELVGKQMLSYTSRCYGVTLAFIWSRASVQMALEKSGDAV